MKKTYLLICTIICFYSQAQIPQLFTDISPTPNVSGVPSYQFSHANAVLGSSLYFAGQTANNKLQLWATDGSTITTQLFKNIYPSGNSQPSYFHTFNNNLYFSADNGINGFQLWKSDGTNAGTNLFATTFTGTPSSGAYPIMVINNKLIFSAVFNSFGDRQLFSTDGITYQSLNVNLLYSAGIGTLGSVDTLNGKMFFAASTTSFPSDQELWVTDGTPSGTMLVKDINIGTSAASGPSDFCRLNNKLYFSAATAAHGFELWETDGTLTGTQIVKDIFTGTSGSSPTRLIRWNNKIYFNASNVVGPGEMYVTDGTLAGTVLFKAGLRLDNLSYLDKGTSLLFAASSSTTGIEWYTTDGTSANTNLLIDIYPGSQNGIWNCNLTSVINNKIYFTGNDAASGPEPWVTDGTVGGTSMLKDIKTGTTGSMTGSDNRFILFNSNIYFTANTSNSIGEELWYFDPNVTTNINLAEIKKSTLTIFPNPSNGNITVNLNDNIGDSKLTIHSILGELVYSEKIVERSINISLNIKPGIYFVSLENKGSKTTRKLIIE